MKQTAIRGATTAKANDAESIKAASVEMAKQIVKLNDLKHEDIITVFLTMTSDLTAFNASSAIRTGLNWNDIPFFTSQEPDIDGMLPHCIRILIQCYSQRQQSDIKHVYLNEAARLRPDLTNK